MFASRHILYCKNSSALAKYVIYFHLNNNQMRNIKCTQVIAVVCAHPCYCLDALTLVFIGPAQK